MRALALGPGDHVVCIASGGCNVLSYLTAGPERIVAVAGVERGLRAGDLLCRARAEVDAQHGQLGNDVVRPAAVDPRGIDRQARTPDRGEAQR